MDQEEHSVIESSSTRSSRWLRDHRLRLALWIAVLEGIVVAVRGDISRWTVVVIAALVLGLYVALRDRIRWDAGRQVLWTVAASQVMALLVVIIAFLAGAIALALVVVLAVVALAYLYADLRRT